MKHYIYLNKFAYDTLASEYYDRMVMKDSSYRMVGKEICQSIFETEPLRSKINLDCEINCLELGCGPGVIVQELRKYHHVNVYAIDFADNMVHFARLANEDAIVKVANILDIKDINDSFQKNLKGHIDIIVMAAFIHLFPKEDAEIILRKIKSWLSPNGIVYIDTTEENDFCDGAIQIKRMLGDQPIKHLRTRWTQDHFNDFLISTGYRIISQSKHTAANNKVWLRTIVQIERK